MKFNPNLLLTGQQLAPTTMKPTTPIHHESLPDGSNRITLLEEDPKKAIARLPEFYTIADALAFTIESARTFSDSDLFVDYYLSAMVENHVDTERHEISFGALAAFAAIYWMKEAEPSSVRHSHNCWIVGLGLLESGEITTAAEALGVSPAHLSGWMRAFDMIAEGSELKFAATLLETDDRNLPTTKEWFTDIDNLSKGITEWSESAERLAAEIRRRNA